MKKFAITAGSFLLPVVAFAQQQVSTGYLESIIRGIGRLINLALPVLIAAGVVYFIFNVVKYIIAGDDNAKEQAKGRIIYGIIGLFVIVAVWGLVNLLGSILGITPGQNNSAPIPTLPTSNF
jgi:hypothetical protein